MLARPTHIGNSSGLLSYASPSDRVRSESSQPVLCRYPITPPSTLVQLV
ncbi:hypothetical protein NYA9BBAC_02666 [Salinibacterium sp. NYA9b]